ncbi:MAG: hypothetical protein R3280_06400 [Marinobacter sp.]|uniref:hypothetical protein n=1 Tax=Marinobacter sp. TaxID=50741 RepID=UPI00299DACA7|nr:hypothetical protein [Marinobacter sp.]MDX1634246.1 hypothetical protein [Marinobacter sp.]
MADPSRWQSLRAAHDDAWRNYEEVVTDVHAAYEEMSAAGKEELPDTVAQGRLADAWERLSEARREIDHYFLGEQGG